MARPAEDRAPARLALGWADSHLAVGVDELLDNGEFTCLQADVHPPQPGKITAHRPRSAASHHNGYNASSRYRVNHDYKRGDLPGRRPRPARPRDGPLLASDRDPPVH
ncbi:hypothetical protein Aph01nite_29070 [Acrocarpospora phusangensis]|uniref:Uncharacterized protein n=1 Tax=Acrocarpospora phusangensis TaxID=1070424 RepID=A0A919QE43_9ACTN|nr:hypothetical protein Aph01nite_29070 [Acrocarpospora phusangensis]